jgi:hypothetical protein
VTLGERIRFLVADADKKGLTAYDLADATGAKVATARATAARMVEQGLLRCTKGGGRGVKTRFRIGPIASADACTPPAKREAAPKRAAIPRVATLAPAPAVVSEPEPEPAPARRPARTELERLAARNEQLIQALAGAEEINSALRRKLRDANQRCEELADRLDALMRSPRTDAGKAVTILEQFLREHASFASAAAARVKGQIATVYQRERLTVSKVSRAGA